MRFIYLSKNFLLFVFFLSTSFWGTTQKKQLDASVYNSWKTLSATQISDSGEIVLYEINPYKGDGFLYIYNEQSQRLDSIPRGKSAQFFHNNTYIAARIIPGYDTLRKLELNKVKKDKWVKDSVLIYSLETNEKEYLPNIHDLATNPKSEWLAVLQTPEKEEKPEPKKTWFRKKQPKPEKKPTSIGQTALVIHPSQKEHMTFEYITKANFSPQGRFLTLIKHREIEKKDSFQLMLYDFQDARLFLSENFSEIGHVVFNEQEERMVFLASNDTIKENKGFSLYKLDLTVQNWSAEKWLHEEMVEDSTLLQVSNFVAPYFSKNNERLFLGWNELPKLPEKDTLLEREKAMVDVWHYQDKRLQPQQLKELKKDKQKAFWSSIELNSNKIVLLEDDTLSIRSLDFGNTDFALGVSRTQYQAEYQWSYPWKADFYKVNLKDGTTELLRPAIGYYMGISPDANHFVYFDETSTSIIALNTITKDTFCLNCSTPDSIHWTRDNNGMPYPEGAFRLEGFTRNNEMLFYSKYDVWKADLENQSVECISNFYGEKNNTVLRIQNLEKDSTFLNLNTIFIHGVNQDSKDESWYSFDSSTKELKELHQSSHKFVNLRKAKNGNPLIVQKMNVRDYPDVYYSKGDFEVLKKISMTNPQQNEYVWPTVETVNWTSYDGKDLEGLLYLPDDFDSTKSYPMLVYFYELYSDRKHQHYIPKPTASIIFATEYTSAGYVVFMPDIRYESGYPARSAYDCIMSGTDFVLDYLPNIDSTRMGLQGQSWGGYQTAQLITMTNRYKAAMAGAPVANMFSAYGGIRWSSGFNRQFQYERTQSRIGKTIWEAPELYVENSPLFGLPNVSTPLLIMHNDNDGAVPWYQGVELFVGLKRLGKPVWMLNYNGDEHNLMKAANREDLSVKMKQFFDHYLMEEPAPSWLSDGVPALQKKIRK